MEIRIEGLRVGYGPRTVIDDLTAVVESGGFTVIVGPNGCGKSTLLRAIARMSPPSAGEVLLDGVPVARLRGKQLARRIALLAQSPTAPAAITVAELVARGRHPYQRLLRQWSARDEEIVAEALTRVRLLDQADRLVEELSGGQRQRAWIAMSLAQQTPVLLLDEPTTYLDVAHQIDVLALCSSLHAAGRTLVAVLHDINQAARYATRVIAMRDGDVVAHGPPGDVFTTDLLREVFDLESLVLTDPETGRPLIVPRDRRDAHHRPQSTSPSGGRP
ncbi:ABC transporter ATP-binding protein [Gordonia iterans]